GSVWVCCRVMFWPLAEGISMLSLMHLCCCWTVVTAYASVYWSADWATELFCLRTA
ncbi:hypothetical protein H0E87_020719, partial [Populus deltoides]